MTDTPKPKQAREWRAEDLGYDGWYIVDGHGNHPKNPSLFVESAAYEAAIKERDQLKEQLKDHQDDWNRAKEALAEFEAFLKDDRHDDWKRIQDAEREAERLNIQAGIYSLEADKWKALAEKMAAVLKYYANRSNLEIEGDGINFDPNQNDWRVGPPYYAQWALAEFEAAKK